MLSLLPDSFYSSSIKAVKQESERIALAKKDDDIDAAQDTSKALNGKTHIYKTKIDATVPRSRHYVGSAN